MLFLMCSLGENGPRMPQAVTCRAAVLLASVTRWLSVYRHLRTSNQVTPPCMSHTIGTQSHLKIPTNRLLTCKGQSLCSGNNVTQARKFEKSSLDKCHDDGVTTETVRGGLSRAIVVFPPPKSCACVQTASCAVQTISVFCHITIIELRVLAWFLAVGVGRPPCPFPARNDPPQRLQFNNLMPIFFPCLFSTVPPARHIPHAHGVHNIQFFTDTTNL